MAESDLKYNKSSGFPKWISLGLLMLSHQEDKGVSSKVGIYFEYTPCIIPLGMNSEKSTTRNP
jgi:hypothetical protein